MYKKRRQLAIALHQFGLFMPYRLFFYSLFIISLLSTYVASSMAHPGKLDKKGGHFNKKANAYQCHTATCFAQIQQTQPTPQTSTTTTDPQPVLKAYSRRDWPHWSDLDHDCQHTRAEILIASSKIPVTFADNNPCRAVISGQWLDPYTNRTFTYANQLEIDHRIALAEAHRYGGAYWRTSQKEQFANDPLNLVAVNGDANQAKKAHPANEWMPKNIQYWCDYILSREAVAKKYALQFPTKELAFNSKIKAQYCPKP